MSHGSKGAASRSLRQETERLGQEILEDGGSDPEDIFHDAAIFLLRSSALALARARGAPVAHVDLLLPPPAAGSLSVASIAAPGTPNEVLTRIYEELLRYQPAVENGRFFLQPVRDRRRAHGAFYTPVSITRRVVRATLNATPLDRPVILDPAMGTGVFLLEAVRALASAGHASRDIAGALIHGIDSDPIAVRIAALSLWLEVGADPERLLCRLTCADALGSALPPVDVIVGNPPWGMRTHRVDSFKRFAVLAAENSRSAVGLVLPQAALAQGTHVDVRRALLGRLDPYAVLDLGDRWFGRAAAPSCALVFGPRPGPRRIAVTGYRRDAPVRHRTIARPLWTETGFPVAGEDALALLARLRARAPVLGELSELFQIHDSGINYGRASVAREALYAAERPADARDLPRFRGRSFHRYTAIRRDGWLRHEWDSRDASNGRLSYDRTLRLVPEKIVLRQTADRIIATLDRTGMVMGRSVIAITASSPPLLLPLLACLNSRLFLVLYGALAGEKGRILPQVKVARLRALPVPPACARGGEGWPTLASLAAEMLAGEGRNRALDEAIDAEVCTLYSLTPADVEAVSF